MANTRLVSGFLAGQGQCGTFTRRTVVCLLWILLYICCHSGFTCAKLVDGGDILMDEVVDSSLYVRNTAVVRQGVILTIRPGVVLTFAPGVMLAVNGTLVAEVIFKPTLYL